MLWKRRKDKLSSEEIQYQMIIEKYCLWMTLAISLTKKGASQENFRAKLTMLVQSEAREAIGGANYAVVLVDPSVDEINEITDGEYIELDRIDRGGHGFGRPRSNRQSGRELLQRGLDFMAEARGSGAYVILAHFLDHGRESTLTSDFDASIGKPYNGDELVRVIREGLSSHQR